MSKITIVTDSGEKSFTAGSWSLQDKKTLYIYDDDDNTIAIFPQFSWYGMTIEDDEAPDNANGTNRGDIKELIADIRSELDGLWWEAENIVTKHGINPEIFVGGVHTAASVFCLALNMTSDILAAKMKGMKK